MKLNLKEIALPRIVSLEKEHSIYVDQSQCKKNIMMNLKVNTVQLKKERELPKLDQELKSAIMFVLKLIFHAHAEQQFLVPQHAQFAEILFINL